MTCRTLILFITLFAVSPSAFAGEKSMLIDPVQQRQNQRMKAFEQKIDFNRAVLNHIPSERIVFDWKNAGIPKHLVGWKLVDPGYTVLEGRRPREIWEWGYTNKSQGIGIEITAYKTGDQEALLAIRDFFTKSSRAEPPFLKGPADLGTISLALPDDFGITLYWAYRNLEFKVEASNKDIALETAYWLNSIAEGNRRPR